MQINAIQANPMAPVGWLIVQIPNTQSARSPMISVEYPEVLLDGGSSWSAETSVRRYGITVDVPTDLHIHHQTMNSIARRENIIDTPKVSERNTRDAPEDPAVPQHELRL